jgi:hypothetical protein
VKRVGPDGRKTYRPKARVPDDEVIEVKVIAEPAVAPERFERVQKVLAELRTSRGDRADGEVRPPLLDLRALRLLRRDDVPVRQR